MDTTGRYYEDTATVDQTSDGAPTTVAAVFVDRERAHEAVHRLHDEGFSDTWIGITRIDDGYSHSTAATASGNTRVESENWFTRFFGEGDESLHDALIRHGVNEADARTAASGTLPAHSAILTVDGSNHPELAAQVVSECGGQLITRGFGATGYGTTGMYGSSAAQAPTSRTSSLMEDGVSPSDRRETRDSVAGSDAYDVAADVAPGTSVPDASAYDDYGRYRAGMPVDESTRIQLREERLRIDKSRISRGEATVGTEIVTETHTIDVPLVREELFIERRPVNDAAPADRAAFEKNRDVIRVPLSEEKITISKTPVVTEEVVIGKRQVEETQHVSETTRKEQLNVEDVNAPVGASVARD